MPVTTITGETRRLDRKHGANTDFADDCEEPLEPGRAIRRPSDEVIIDDVDIAPAELLGAIDEAVLAPTTYHDWCMSWSAVDWRM